MYELIFIVIVFAGRLKNVRLPGIEPGLEAVSLLLVRLLPAKGCWEAPVIAAGPQPHIGLFNLVCLFTIFAVIMVQAIYRLWFDVGVKSFGVIIQKTADERKLTQIRYHKSAFIRVYLRFKIYKYFMIAPQHKVFDSIGLSLF